MTHEERARFVRQQIALARMGGGASGTGADVAQRIVEMWEVDLNEARTDGVNRLVLGMGLQEA